MKDLKIFLFNLIVIILGVIILLVTSLLFNLNFVQAHVTRQIIVGIVMLVEFYLVSRIIYEYNKIKT